MKTCFYNLQWTQHKITDFVAVWCLQKYLLYKKKPTILSGHKAKNEM